MNVLSLQAASLYFVLFVTGVLHLMSEIGLEASSGFLKEGSVFVHWRVNCGLTLWWAGPCLGTCVGSGGLFADGWSCITAQLAVQPETSQH